MNIHLPAILMFTRGTRFWHTAICPNDFRDLNWVQWQHRVPIFPVQETQFVIDQGGQPTTTGAIFTFRGDLRGDGLSPAKMAMDQYL